MRAKSRMTILIASCYRRQINYIKYKRAFTLIKLAILRGVKVLSCRFTLNTLPNEFSLTIGNLNRQFKIDGRLVWEARVLQFNDVR